jgi:hypothetical protein
LPAIRIGLPGSIFLVLYVSDSTGPVTP